MLLVYMICTAMYGNGVQITGIITIQGHQMMGVVGNRATLILPDCYEVAHGSVILATVVHLLVYPIAQLLNLMRLDSELYVLNPQKSDITLVS